jgi:hypothetical protein
LLTIIPAPVAGSPLKRFSLECNRDLE